MKIYFGETGLDNTHQMPFEAVIPCPTCGGAAQVMFVGFEDSRDEPCVCDLPVDGTPDKGCLWPHDCIAVAVYVCRECFATTAKMNQA